MCEHTLGPCVEIHHVQKGRRPPCSEGPASDWGVTLLAPYRGPKPGGRGVPGPLQSTAQLWLPLHSAAEMTSSGRSALPGTPWLPTLRVRSPGGSPRPAPASPPRPLAPCWSAHSAAPRLLRDLLGSLRPRARGEPFLPSQKDQVLHTHLCALGPLLPPGWDHSPQS